MEKTEMSYISRKVGLLTAWVKTHPFESFLLFLIFCVATYMRFYRIADYMTFLGDEGRDVIIVRRFLTQGDIMLIGPGTSIGNMYLGPLYYYMMAPALFLALYSPVGPAVMIALLGVITVLMIWWVGRTWFGASAGLISAALYAIAPTIVIYSHSSWNPNIMPFFALLTMWSIWKVWNDRVYWWLLVFGVAIAGCLQSHYLGLILVPAAGLFWILAAWRQLKERKLNNRFVLFSFLGGVLFLLMMSPLFVFDVRHNWMNFNAIKVFFTERQTTVSIKPWNALPGMFPQLTKITTRLVTGYNKELGQWAALGLLGGVLLFVAKSRFRLSQTSTRAALMLVSWIGLGLLGLALYKQEIYDHYYGFLFPAFFLLTGGALSLLWGQYKLRGRWLVLTVFLVLVWVNLSASPLQYEPNKQYPRSVAVSEFIVKESGGQPFNFAVIAERNYEGAYQYFLDQSTNFRVIDPQNTKDTITSQLFVVCEMQKEKCDPTHNAKAEIANFGWSKIDTSWDVSGVTVFKLTHSYPTATPSASPSPVKK